MFRFNFEFSLLQFGQEIKIICFIFDTKSASQEEGSTGYLDFCLLASLSNYCKENTPQNFLLSFIIFYLPEGIINGTNVYIN